MKTNNIHFLPLFLLLSIFIGCKSTQGLSKEEIIQNIDNKIQEQSYVFEADQAGPANGSIIYLTSPYSLKVSPDTLIAFLPYFGRAYSAPSPMEEGGIKFTSTNFDYSASDKEKGVYTISVNIKDDPNKYNLSLLIGENGKGTLHVTQMNKQSITFYGNIE